MSKYFAFLAVIILSVATAYACGCGMALADTKVFNSLKETQAYLLIDVKDRQSYIEMPFFRMVSMDETYNVTIVFPVEEIPADVTGKVLTADEFLKAYGINDAEMHIEKQSPAGLGKKVRSDLRSVSSVLFPLANGAPGFYFMVLSSMITNRAFDKALNGASAHYEFEGGSLDIYDVKSAATLDELVKRLNMTSQGKVRELIDKYKDDYVAVLYLKVPSVLNDADREWIRRCPDQAGDVKRALEERSEFSRGEMYELTEGECQNQLMYLMQAVTMADSSVNGTLVMMRFENTSRFFYPTSIVNSYKYPITDQRYFVKVPVKLAATLETSKVKSIATFSDERWYKVTSTEEDLSGNISAASFANKRNDMLRKNVEWTYDRSVLAALLIMLVAAAVAAVTLIELDMKDILITLAGLVIGGCILASIVLLAKRKWLPAAGIIGFWVFALVMRI